MTSLWSRTGTLNSPSCLIGSSSWILRRSMVKFSASRAPAMSFDVTEPNNWSLSPAFCAMVTLMPFTSLARSSASPLSLASLRTCAWRSCSTILRLASVAATASRLGNRKLRAYPGATFTNWPRLPSFSISDLRMTSIPDFLPPLELRRERQQRDVARLLDGVGQAPLMRSADAGNAARDDLAPFRHEGVEHFHVLVIDVVDLLDAEPAHFLAPEKLLLLGGYRFVAAGGPLRGAAWSSFELGHLFIIHRSVSSVR